ncbi:MAG: hypothetical protein SGPRY_001621 [Prymnesium sp.]
MPIRFGDRQKGKLAPRRRSDHTPWAKAGDIHLGHAWQVVECEHSSSLIGTCERSAGVTSSNPTKSCRAWSELFDKGGCALSSAAGSLGEAQDCHRGWQPREWDKTHMREDGFASEGDLTNRPSRRIVGKSLRREGRAGELWKPGQRIWPPGSTPRLEVPACTPKD